MSKSTAFRAAFDEDQLGCTVEYRGCSNKLIWQASLSAIDYSRQLPLFFDGILDEDEPYCFIAREGIFGLLEYGEGKVIPVFDLLIPKIKKALQTKNPVVVSFMMEVLQEMILNHEGIADLIIKKARQILPFFNMFRKKHLDVRDQIQETLELLQASSKVEDSAKTIGQMVPTFRPLVFSK
eukprot:TRINITY_DN776215_c0_g1_i1.p1 TRINITY_DN776215_c0_g1~~TRINITY_DN776215_c0_g1_i1.p1  ORF type:complete len:181 (+),score=43.94 TRINITY_DN776215_c0_g1_i1:137-679(+)